MSFGTSETPTPGSTATARLGIRAPGQHVYSSLLSTLLSIRLPLYPDLRVELYSAFSAELVERLLSSKLDLALIANMNPKQRAEQHQGKSGAVSYRPFAPSSADAHGERDAS